jgi:hypothetical protein
MDRSGRWLGLQAAAAWTRSPAARTLKKSHTRLALPLASFAHALRMDGRIPLLTKQWVLFMLARFTLNRLSLLWRRSCRREICWCGGCVVGVHISCDGRFGSRNVFNAPTIDWSAAQIPIGVGAVGARRPPAGFGSVIELAIRTSPFAYAVEREARARAGGAQSGQLVN